MEGDEGFVVDGYLDDISIHSLRMEGDFLSDAGVPENIVFQSTPSAWRETQTDYRRIERRCISIHSLRMEGDYESKTDLGFCDISIHSLRMEGDQSLAQGISDNFISIHSLRMEGDMRRCRRFLLGFHFNPLPPHGGRRT